MRQRYRQLGWWGVLVLVALTVMGCGHVMSEAVRRNADRSIPFAALQANPDSYRGRTVILGGQIMQTQNTPEGTFMEVIHKPLDGDDRPIHTDYSEGRFMARCERYLDPAVYTKGRQITLGGRILGAQAGQIGEMPYTYPLVSCLEVHLWPRVVVVEPRYGPYPWWYRDPWYWDYWRWRRYPYPYRGPYPPYWWW